MSKAHPVKKYMTEAPRTIGKDILLSKATEVMREHRIRHLPVQYGGKLVGILSDRDVQVALSIHPSARDLKVSDIMTEDPYAVTADCPLEQVAAEMAKNKFGCAIVENENGRVIGVFTAVDALRLLAEWLRKKTIDEPAFESTERLIS